MGFMVAGCELFNSGEKDQEDVTSTWVAIERGAFNMGDAHVVAAAPVHLVTVPEFAMLRTEVTVSQYSQCVTAGFCTPPNTSREGCNWNQMGFEEHPINCVTWPQAVQFCAWVGGRLPSEAEWEYAARSEGDNRPFPWGTDSPSCTLAIMNESGIAGCGNGGTWPVCSKPSGKTDQGLCDMSGNVYEWVQDIFHTDYIGNVPTNGSAWEEVSESTTIYRVIRGASYNAQDSDSLKAASRADATESDFSSQFGIRCAKSL
jgi:formylglycine-generating enzyme required for sulfatase activity